MAEADKVVPYRLTDKLEIRRLLNTDREWSLYALADLDDGMFEHCDWRALPHALVLVFRAIAIRPVFVLGDAESTKKLLGALPETTGYLNLKAHQIDAAEGIYRYRERHQMRRMFLDAFQPRSGITEPLGAKDCSDIEHLYASGDGGGIAFAPFQLHTGFFHGIRRDGELVAVAGVQVVSRSEGVAAIGNIFTRPDCRGQGLAQTVTSAVATAIRDAGIQTIGLNVESTNASAIRAYERVGFRTHFSYSEGIADRLGTETIRP
ncbi:MAG: GNAT family N-acetyltransferase [Acidobacteriia bacterium]|nr:GNAT family N-acetyltransferase [Terriglobia bacterium]